MSFPPAKTRAMVSPIKRLQRRIPLDVLQPIRRELVEPTKTHRRYTVPRDIGEEDDEGSDDSEDSI